MYRTAAATLLLILAAPAAAQDAPSFDCADAGSTAEELICADPELARLDRNVAQRFSDAIAAVRGLDAGAEEAEAGLRAYQRGWIGGRDECWKSVDPRDCIASSYLRREAELVATWYLEDPVGTSFWACGGSPANEVVTIFFDTELPAVRFERGDSIDAGGLASGSLVASGSGTRYEGSFGRRIVIESETARYREPDPDGTEFDCVLTRSE